MELASSQDLVGLAGIVDAVTNGLLASTTCFSRRAALLSAAVLPRLSEAGEQTDNRMLRTLLLLRPQIDRLRGRPLRMMLNHAIDLTREAT